MQVNLDKVFKLSGPASNAWTFLQDIPAVARCLPGAEITEQVDDANYKGTVKVKIGPATANFKGDINIKSIDASKQQIQMVGKGGDVKGTSSATMDLTASVRELEGGGCELVGYAEVSVTGKMASLGGRMMNQVSDQILNQFGDNFANQVLAMGEGEAAEAAAEKAAQQPKELNGFAFIWSLLMNNLRKVFGGSK
ncbi:SRPBCC family protein [Saccharospirillum impatiens]|uniref:SRPBCC family protein n=1 Tax=Saccharospirillum impatiens TaxID=169438 RepID=UPI0003F4D8E4|nr:SRPBCC family protein [Saccharospirillum impatiens]